MRKLTFHETGPNKLDLQISRITGSPNGPRPLLEILQGGVGITLSEQDCRRLVKVFGDFITGDL